MWDLIKIWTGLTIGQLDAAEGKVDDGWVLLLDKVVLCETLDVQDEVRR